MSCPAEVIKRRADSGFLRKLPLLRLLILGIASLTRSPKRRFVLARSALVSAVPIFLFYYHDPTRHFMWAPDWDVRVVYEALLVFEGRAGIEYAYTGYGLFYLLAEWYRLLDLVGVLDIISIDSIPPAPASNAVFQELMYWARTLTLILSSALVISLMFIAQIITGSRYYGFLAALAFSGTQSVNNHVVHLRSEMPSALFSYLAILFILLAVKKKADRALSLLFIGLSSFCALFSLYSKVSSISMVLILPLFPLFFFSAFPSAIKAPPGPIGIGAAGALVALASAAGYVFLGPFIGSMGTGAYFYNGAIILYIAVCIVIFCRMQDQLASDMVSAGAAIILGLAGAQFMLLGTDPHAQSVSVANHIGFLAGLKFAGAEGDMAQSAGSMSLIAGITSKLATVITKVFSESYFNFCWVCRRPSIVYLLSLITLGVVWRKYGTVIRLRASFLILCLIFIEMIMRYHVFNSFYRMYVEGLLMATTVYYIILISRKSSMTARKSLAVFTFIFAVWFWIDDVNRKMLWPTFAPHVGSLCVPEDKMPQVKDLIEHFCKMEKDFLDKVTAKMLPPGSVPPAWEDTRSFLWKDEPWRRWDDK